MKNLLKSKWLRIEVLGIGAMMVIGLVNCQQQTQSKTSPVEAMSANEADFESIFDGKTLQGWEGDPVYWSVKDGAITGEITPETLLKANTFLIWQGGQPGDFELKAEFKISESGNSGINYRSEMVEDVPFALKGYQADIDGKNNYTGQNYEERKRTTLAYRGQITKITTQPEGVGTREFVERNAWKGLNLEKEIGDRAELGALIKAGEWNSIHIIAKGNVLQHFVNGQLMSEVHDEDAVNKMDSGYLGVQVHVGPPMMVQFKDLMLKQ
ncbi:3-keto-disaccharide hydrolase [Algoriphagus sp. D3-2-R+10]|uniref:3-keto-disaccharide hydrolase n=1 Tax=Algoriphagus aurantiacus TaxID=3103948 RepID=UPI003A5D0233